VIYQDDGAANLFIGSGQSLVVGSEASSLSTVINQYNAEDRDVILTQGNGTTDVTNQITGGELQGVLSFKEDVLETSRRSLGRVAIAISEEMNTQHRLGMTIQGTSTPFPLGQDFFSDIGGPIIGLPGQQSTNSATLNITDSRVLATSDYQLDYDGSNLTLTRLSDNKIFTGTAGATLTDTINNLNLQIDPAGPPYAAGTDPQGFSISNTSVISGGDTFLMRPTFEGAANIGVSVNNVLDIALAGPIVSKERTNSVGGATNFGSGEITMPNITDLTGIPTTGNTIDNFNFTLSYTNTNLAGNPGFNVVSSDATAVPGSLFADFSIDFDPNADFGGKTITLDGLLGMPDFGDMTFTLSGKPEVGDTFEIENNHTPYDDNRNGLLMLKLQTTKTLENSSTDFQAGYGVIVSDVGTKTHSAEVDLLAQQTLSEQAKATREGYSGVNLDEEAADLLKFQQAYQASAKVISTADQMFQTLIGAV